MFLFPDTYDMSNYGSITPVAVRSNVW